MYPLTFVGRCSIALLLAGGFAAHSQGPAAAPPDKFTEALLYAEFAREAFLCQGARSGASENPAAEAVSWTEQAIQTARQFKGDRIRQARVKEFLRRQKSELDTFRQWEGQLRDADKTIANALNQGYLEKAERSLPGAGAPPCDARFLRWRPRVAQQRRVFDDLVRQGDQLSADAPRQAMSKYSLAQSMNRVDKVLNRKIRELKYR